MIILLNSASEVNKTPLGKTVLETLIQVADFNKVEGEIRIPTNSQITSAQHNPLIQVFNQYLKTLWFQNVRMIIIDLQN